VDAAAMWCSCARRSVYRATQRTFSLPHRGPTLTLPFKSASVMTQLLNVLLMWTTPSWKLTCEPAVFHGCTIRAPYSIEPPRSTRLVDADVWLAGGGGLLVLGVSASAVDPASPAKPLLWLGPRDAVDVPSLIVAPSSLHNAPKQLSAPSLPPV
jgi:hypothetical protein